MQVSLKVIRGKSAGKEIAIPVSSFLIGRSEDCHLRPKSDAISRRHCELLVKEDKVWVQDLGSRNGTLVNGKKITEMMEVSSGDVLRVGKLEFEIAIRHPSLNDDSDISGWLDADQDADVPTLADPETRQFKLDETQQSELTRVAEEAEEQAAKEQAAKEEEEEESKDDTTGFLLNSQKGAKEKKAKPGKLPTRSGPKTADSTSAAADALKNFFNNRS